MPDERMCDYCGERVGDEPIQHGDGVYCSEACAFEAQRPADCGGRNDTVIGSSIHGPDPVFGPGEEEKK